MPSLSLLLPSKSRLPYGPPPKHTASHDVAQEGLEVRPVVALCRWDVVADFLGRDPHLLLHVSLHDTAAAAKVLRAVDEHLRAAGEGGGGRKGEEGARGLNEVESCRVSGLPFSLYKRMDRWIDGGIDAFSLRQGEEAPTLSP